MANSEDQSGDIEFDFQDDSEEEDDDIDDVSTFINTNIKYVTFYIGNL